VPANRERCQYRAGSIETAYRYHASSKLFGE
jgi:hypothetical protein